jgi:hypothetical protein
MAMSLDPDDDALWARPADPEELSDVERRTYDDLREPAEEPDLDREYHIARERVQNHGLPLERPTERKA